MKSILNRARRFRERFVQTFDPGPTTGPTPTNHNNLNVVSGSGAVINSNQNIVTNKINGSALKGESVVHSKIVAALIARYVPQAVYDAQLGTGCMEGTRVQVLREIEAWIKNLDGPQIFWLSGMAGTGKSAIAWTICAHANVDTKVILGGSFFCSRSAGVVTQRDVRCVVPTLAQLLALQSPKFSQALAEELARNPNILNEQIGAQVEQLLYKPLLALKYSHVPILFVIDALDECSSHSIANEAAYDAESHHMVSEMLEALVSFSRFSDKLPVKFLVTSRPETHICDTPVSDTSFSTVFRLHVINVEQVTADIRLYINTKLSSSPKLRARFTDDEADVLARLCDGLFIFATTALQYALGAAVDTAAMTFKTLLDTSHAGVNAGASAPLDCMYAVILADALRVEEHDTNERPTILQLLTSLLCTRMALSVASLANIVGMPTHHTRSSLRRLHAVIHVPEDDNEPGLRTLHASFGDYLFNSTFSDLRISESMGHDILARGCLRRMAQDDLCFNVSHTRSSFYPNPESMPDGVSLSLVYACLHWAHHIDLASNRSAFDAEVGNTFRVKFLFWLEALSILGKIGFAPGLLRIAGSAVKDSVVSQFLRDANAFVASSHDAISRSAPHIYISALPFAAKDSLVYRDFAPLYTGVITVTTAGFDGHGERLVATLCGHSSVVYSVAYSSDGLSLASGSNDGTVRIWDTRTGEETMSPLRNDGRSVYSVVISPDGRLIASGMSDGAVCVWNVSTGRASLKPLRGHSASVRSVLFSPDGSYIASASSDKTVRLWASETGQLHKEICDHHAAVNEIAFSPDGRVLASCSEDRTIRLWDAATGEPALQPLRDHNNHVLCVAFSSCGKMFASGSEDRTIILWDTQHGRNIRTLHGHSAAVRSVRFSPDGQSLVSAADDHSVRLWTLGYDGAEPCFTILGGHAGAARSAVFSPDGLYIASASDDQTIRIWDSGNRLSAVEHLPGHTDQVRSLAVSPDSSFFVSGSDDKSVRVWSMRTGDMKLPPLQGHTGWVSSVAVSPDGLLIASASEDHTVRLWDARTGKNVGKSLRGHTSFVTAVAFSPDARWVVSGSLDATLRMWDVMTGRLSNVGPFLCLGGVNAVALSPDGRILAAGDDSSHIHLWHADTGLQAHQPLRVNAMGAIGFSPDGSKIASGGSGNASVWRIGTGQQALVLNGHTSGVRSVAYSPDGQFICTGSNDQTVRLWDAATGSLVATLHGHGGWVCSVVFAPDGQSIISGSWDKTIRVWDVAAARSLSPKSADSAVKAKAPAQFDDGWLLGPSGELLLWVPVEYRTHLLMPPCTTLIGQYRVSIKTGDNELHVGETWTSCWRGNSRAALSKM